MSPGENFISLIATDDTMSVRNKILSHLMVLPTKASHNPQFFRPQRKPIIGLSRFAINSMRSQFSYIKTSRAANL